MTLETAIALSIGLAASTEDIWRRNISNWIPLAALVGGLAVRANQGGWNGVGSWFLGALAGFSVFFIFYMLGGMGGGDVKLMAGFGSILGPSRLLEAALWTAGIGGIMAACVVVYREIVRLWRKRRASDKTAKDGATALAQQEDPYIPYAPAITLGSWLALIPKGV
jgi:prepilin peptidase CpaA